MGTSDTRPHAIQGRALIGVILYHSGFYIQAVNLFQQSTRTTFAVDSHVLQLSLYLNHIPTAYEGLKVK